MDRINEDQIKADPVKEKKTEEIKTEAGQLKCPVQAALYYTEEFLAGPMCGKCFPCAMGSYEAKLRLEALKGGTGSEADLMALGRISREMLISSRCKKGRDTAKFLSEWLDTGDLKAHTTGLCATGSCVSLLQFRVIADKCNACGLCKDACKDNAILGEKAVSYLAGYMPFEIRLKRCTRCGLCVPACPEDAIEAVSVSGVEAEKQEKEVKA